MQGPLVVIGHVVAAGNFRAASGSTYMIGKDGSADQVQELKRLYQAQEEVSIGLLVIGAHIMLYQAMTYLVLFLLEGLMLMLQVFLVMPERVLPITMNVLKD